MVTTRDGVLSDCNNFAMIHTPAADLTSCTVACPAAASPGPSQRIQIWSLHRRHQSPPPFARRNAARLSTQIAVRDEDRHLPGSGCFDGSQVVDADGREVSRLG
jgi:hypothetical protein